MPKVKDKIVIQKNIIIAEFMGGEPANKVKDNPIAYIFPFEFGHQETWDEFGFQGSGASSCWDIGDLQYHLSWDWIIPVYQKIMKGYYGTTIMEISNEENHLLEQIKTHLSQTDIKNLHNWIYEFIKWYNENKKD